MWPKRHVSFRWMLVARSSAQGSAVRLAWEAALASGSFPAAPGDGHCKAFAGLAHLNSVRRVLFLGLFADKETAKNRSVICLTSVNKWRSQDSNSCSGSKPGPFNRCCTGRV